MSFTTDGTQRITIISKNNAVNDSANLCHFNRRGEGPVTRWGTSGGYAGGAAKPTV